MSKIQQITTGQVQASNSRQSRQAEFEQKFRGNPLPKANIELEAAKKFVLDEVEALTAKQTGKMGKFLHWMGIGKGEVQNQLVTALFTTTLAPAMIVFNPMAKNKTKEDKKYLALRQPISALIALSGGLAMTKLSEHVLDKIYNEGVVESLDLRLKPNKDYLEGSFNKAFDDAKKNNQLKEFLTKYDGDVSSQLKASGMKGNKVSKAYKHDCFMQGYLKKVQEQRLGFFTSLISEKPDNIKLDDSGNIVVGGKNLQEGHLIKTPNLSTQKELDAYLQKNNLFNITLGDLMKEKFGFEFYENAQGAERYKVNINNDKLSKVKALDFLEEIGLIKEKSVSETELKEVLQRFRQHNKAGEYGELFGLEANKAEKALNLSGADTSRNVQMTVGEQIGKAKSISLGQMLHQLGYKTSNGKIQGLMDKNMADALFELKGMLNGRLKGVDNKADLKYFAKNLLGKAAATVGQNAGTHRYYITIFVNIFSTLVTCTVLNWAYPRLVEYFFPKLAHAKGKQAEQSVPPPVSKQIEVKKGGNE